MTTLTINKQALLHNINVIKKLSDHADTIAVVKGNAYGLELCSFAKLLEQSGIRHFAVTDLADAITLRKSGICSEILMLAPLYDSEEIHSAIINQITLCITSETCGAAAEHIAQKLSTHVCAHLCIDTGFGKYGFLDSQKDKIIETIQYMKHIEVTGIFSHFYGSGCKNSSHIHQQFKRFLNLCDTLTEENISVGMRHIAATGSLLRFPYTRLDAVRIGSGFLGRLAFPDQWGFIPIGTLDAQIDDIHILPAGHNVGYGNSYTTTHTTTIAVVSAGYFHGLGLERQTSPIPAKKTPCNLLRAIKNHFNRKPITATLGPHSLPIIGKIGMNSLVIDITGYSLSAGDHVTFPVNPLYVNSSVPRVYLEHCPISKTNFNSITDNPVLPEQTLLKVI